MIDQQRGRSMPLRSLDREVPEIAVRGDAQPRALADVLVRDTTVAYAFIAPAFFLLLFLVAYPFALSVWLSFSDARVGETGSFVGLENFQRLLTSSIFLQTLQNSIIFTALALSAKTVFGMILALLLFRIGKFKRLIRGAVLLPFIVPTALSTLVWWWMFEPLYSSSTPGAVCRSSRSACWQAWSPSRARCTRRRSRTAPAPWGASGTSRYRCSSPCWRW